MNDIKMGMLCYCCCSFIKACLTLLDPMNCSMSGSSIFHQVSKFVHIHVTSPIKIALSLSSISLFLHGFPLSSEQTNLLSCFQDLKCSLKVTGAFCSITQAVKLQVQILPGRQLLPEIRHTKGSRTWWLGCHILLPTFLLLDKQFSGLSLLKTLIYNIQLHHSYTTWSINDQKWEAHL